MNSRIDGVNAVADIPESAGGGRYPRPFFARPAFAGHAFAGPTLARWFPTACHARTSRVSTLEFTHEGDQRLDAGERHGIVEARAHAAQHPVSLETVQAGIGRLGKECSVQLRLVQGECHVHPGPGIPRYRVLI